MKQNAKLILTLLMVGLVAVFASGCVDEEPVEDVVMDEEDVVEAEDSEEEVSHEEEITLKSATLDFNVIKAVPETSLRLFI